MKRTSPRRAPRAQARTADPLSARAIAALKDRAEHPTLRSDCGMLAGIIRALPSENRSGEHLDGLIAVARTLDAWPQVTRDMQQTIPRFLRALIQARAAARRRKKQDGGR